MALYNHDKGLHTTVSIKSVDNLKSSQPENISTKSNKKKIFVTTQTMVEQLSGDADIWKCLVCGKELKSEIGARGHAYAMHVRLPMLENEKQPNSTIGSENSNESNKKLKLEIVCPICGKIVANEEALFQHRISKHAPTEVDQDELILMSSNQVAEKYDLNDLQKEIELFNCSICGHNFYDHLELERHVTLGWQPIDVTAIMNWSCSQCSKQFREERAMKQHYNFCKLKSLHC